ncbi:MAG: mshD [Glaciihabitans sp.]|nr:mshD [Glaciihabitans sp.]
MSDSAQSDPDWLFALADRARGADGSPPFSDGALVEYRQGARSLVSIGEVAAALVRPGTDDAEAEFVVDPDARGRGNGTALLETLLSTSPGGLRIWAHGDHPAARALAASHGLVAVRTLLHLAANLRERPSSQPSSGSQPTSTAAPVEQRSFSVGQDERAWLDVNARTFASHEEQGRVTLADLQVLESEPWFRADDFLLLERDGILFGFCWLKIEGQLGEFYVVGVDPDHQGEGLGRTLVEAGVARLLERGIHSAHLYVEGDNEAALRLYRSFGFTEASVDIQYQTHSGG